MAEYHVFSLIKYSYRLGKISKNIFLQVSTFEHCDEDDISLKHVQWTIQLNRLTKLMVLCDLLHSTVTNQVDFDQRDLHLTNEFKCTIDCRYQAHVPNWKPYILSLLPYCKEV